MKHNELSGNIIDRNKKAVLFQQLYSEVDISNIVITWSRNRTNKLYIMGFKYCDNCSVMIKTEEIFCRKCGRKMRHRPLKKSHLVMGFSIARYYNPSLLEKLRGE